MLKKIGIVELFYHHEVILHFVKLFSGSGLEVQFFVAGQVFRDINDYGAENIHWIVKSPQQSTAGFLESNRQLLNENELLIFTTIVGEFALFSRLALKPITLLIIHNANAFLQTKQSLAFSSHPASWLKDFGRLLRNICLKREIHFRRQLLSRINYICFPSPAISQYNAAHLRPFACRLCPPLPLAFYQGSFEGEMDIVQISIPGTVINKGRDYRLVAKALRAVLPGRLMEGECIKELKELQEHGNTQFELLYFDHSLSQAEYDYWLQRTDFFILPLKKHRRFSLYREKTGLTKISGGINDMIRFGIPSLLPSLYPLEESLEFLNLRYSGLDELKKNLLFWINEKGFNSVKEKAQKLSDTHGKKQILEQTLQTFEQILYE